MRLARRLAIAALVSVALLALPSLARAATYCVNDSGCAGVTEPDLQSALSAAAASTSEADTVQVGDPGAPTGSGWSYSDGGHAANQVDIIGAGPSNTVLADAAAGTILAVQGAGSTISDLTVQLPSASATGIATSGSLSNVDVTSLDNGSHSQTGAVLLGNGGSQQWNGGGITLPDTGVGNTDLVHSGGPTSIDLEDLTLTAAGGGVFPNVGDNVTIRRSSITALIAAVNGGGHLTLDNVVYRAPSAVAPVPFLITEASGSNNATTDLNHVTAFGNGVMGSLGLEAADAASHTATVNVRNSIVRNFFYLLVRSASNSGGASNVNLSYSDIDLTHKIDTNAGGGTGTINVGPGMIDADPLFTNPSADDFSLKPGSPAIDTGDPAGLLPGDSATDVLGAPRISNGRQDMGAVELQVPPPVTPPAPPAPPAKDRLAPKLKLSKLPRQLKLKQLLKGIKFTVTTSEPSRINASLAGSASSVKLARSFNFTLAQKKLGLKAGKRRITLKVRKKILGHSRKFTVRLTVSATDASGNVSTVRRTIKVR